MLFLDTTLLEGPSSPRADAAAENNNSCSTYELWMEQQLYILLNLLNNSMDLLSNHFILSHKIYYTALQMKQNSARFKMSCFLIYNYRFLNFLFNTFHFSSKL